MGWLMTYDKPDSKPYMVCEDLGPILSFIVAPGPWIPKTTRGEAKEQAMEEGIASVVLTDGSLEGKRMEIFIRRTV